VILPPLVFRVLGYGFIAKNISLKVLIPLMMKHPYENYHRKRERRQREEQTEQQERGGERRGI
jgi:hypothetical protein